MTQVDSGGLTFVLVWVDVLVEAPVLAAAGHLDDVELSYATFTLR